MSYREWQKKRRASFQGRAFGRHPEKCSRCDNRKRVEVVERYGVALCKRCTFEMDTLTRQPTGPGMYPR